MGVAGRAESNPYLPDGKFQPEMPLTCLEARLRDRVKSKLGWLVTPTRTANITKPLNGRAPCHYCGPCERGCVTHSYFNSAFTTVADAMASGNCTLIPNAMAYQVLMDADRNRRAGCSTSTATRVRPREVEARAVVLSAQALESVRILLNSANRQYPNGLANSSGVLGHYLMDHVTGGGATGEFPDLAVKPSLDGPHRPSGLYVARFRNVPGAVSKKFLRGYGFQGGGHSRLQLPCAGIWRGLQEISSGPHHQHQPWRLWREPGALGKLCGDRSRRPGYFRNPRAAHAHELRRERARHGARHGGQRGGNAGGGRGQKHPPQ